MIQILITIVLLIGMEAILSFDNAIALATIVRSLPVKYRSKALTYGVAGAFLFRFLVLFTVTAILKYPAVKAVGGAYLFYICVKHFLSNEEDSAAIEITPMQFWKTVLIIELTDIAFSLDSIFGAIAISDEFWVLFTGAVLGIILMRIAAGVLTNILDNLPWLQHAAYGLIGWAGIKMCFDVGKTYI